MPVGITRPSMTEGIFGTAVSRLLADPNFKGDGRRTARENAATALREMLVAMEERGLVIGPAQRDACLDIIKHLEG